MAEAQRDLTPEQAAARLRACSEIHYLDSIKSGTDNCCSGTIPWKESLASNNLVKNLKRSFRCSPGVHADGWYFRKKNELEGILRNKNRS